VGRKIRSHTVTLAVTVTAAGGSRSAVTVTETASRFAKLEKFGERPSLARHWQSESPARVAVRPAWVPRLAVIIGLGSPARPAALTQAGTRRAGPGPSLAALQARTRTRDASVTVAAARGKCTVLRSVTRNLWSSESANLLSDLLLYHRAVTIRVNPFPKPIENDALNSDLPHRFGLHGRDRLSVVKSHFKRACRFVLNSC
jgi:hypothetical protein